MIYEIEVQYENSYGEMRITTVDVDSDRYPDIRSIEDAKLCAHEIVDGAGMLVYETRFNRTKGMRQRRADNRMTDAASGDAWARERGLSD